MEFDVSVDLVAGHLPQGLAPTDAVRRVRAAVEALPGAMWVSVEWCGDAPAIRWLRLYRRGRGEEMKGDPWDRLRNEVKVAVAQALRSAS